MNRGGDHQTLAARAAGAERDRTILSKRLEGHPPAAIAKELSISERTVFKACARALSHVDIGGAAEAKQRMIARLDLVRVKLFERLNANVPDLVTVASAIVRVEQREAALLGLDMPERLILASLPMPPDRDKITLAQLDRLSPDELRTLHDILSKAREGDPDPPVETTATPVRRIGPLPEAPDFDDDAS